MMNMNNARLALEVFLMSLFLTCMMGCASGPQYPKYRTMDEALTNYDTNAYKDGVARTANGNLVDIKFEEVVSQRDALKTKLDRAGDDISYRDGRIQELEAQIMELRVHIGLPAHRPQAKAEIGKNGYINKATFIPSPTIDDELKSQ